MPADRETEPFCHACGARLRKAEGELCGERLDDDAKGRPCYCRGKYGPPLDLPSARAIARVESRLYRIGSGYVWERYQRGRTLKSNRLPLHEAKAACEAWQSERAAQLMGKCATDHEDRLHV